jgi:hypothetical protein
MSSWYFRIPGISLNRISLFLFVRPNNLMPLSLTCELSREEEQANTEL